MANLKTSCLRKGVVAGRIGHALSELHIQVDVAGDMNLDVTRGALGEIKDSLGTLRKNFKTSGQEVQAIGEGVKKITKLLRGEPSIEAISTVKTELRAIRDNFRKTIHTGSSECGSRGPYGYELVDLIDDNAYYQDTHPTAIPPS